MYDSSADRRVRRPLLFDATLVAHFFFPSSFFSSCFPHPLFRLFFIFLTAALTGACVGLFFDATLAAPLLRVAQILGTSTRISY
jgi:hypothetical protein